MIKKDDFNAMLFDKCRDKAIEDIEKIIDDEIINTVTQARNYQNLVIDEIYNHKLSLIISSLNRFNQKAVRNAIVKKYHEEGYDISWSADYPEAVDYKKLIIKNINKAIE